MQNKTLKIDRAFFLLLVLIFLAGLLRTVFRPKEINEYENRYANQLAPLTAVSYADGSFQDGMESALSDQVQFSQLAKKTYNFVTSYAAVPLIVPLENLTHGYVSAGDVSFYESKIVYQPWTSLQPEWLEPKAENLNAAIAAHPELEFYAYYIETVNILKGFVFRSWMDYLTFGRYGTGGWASPDGTINCVEQAYDFESERFLVSLLKHEAQHAMDMKRFPKITPAELEYRAKLVELHYSGDLGLLQKFLSEADESRTGDSHAAASARIRREFAGTDQANLPSIQARSRELLHAHTKELEVKYGH